MVLGSLAIYYYHRCARIDHRRLKVPFLFADNQNAAITGLRNQFWRNFSPKCNR